MNLSNPPSQITDIHDPADDLSEFPDDPRLMQAAQEYLQDLEAGRRPNRKEFLRRFPDLVVPLAQCLDGIDMVQGAACRDRESLGPVPLTAESIDPATANPLGDFKLLREIGRGGMGIVYEAVQLSLGRRVALKVLPFAATFDAKQLQRFHNEAQAAAQLHHTNIVPVYAVGSERGVHFYAMQLIEGHSLALVIQQVRQELGRPDPDESNARSSVSPSRTVDQRGVATHANESVEPASHLSRSLSTSHTSRPRDFFRTASALIVQAADALEHAHQFGIVHRDIKPANLLVDAHGRLWITDFGVAQFHADAGLTQTGDILGTLRYMSPEQATGQRSLLDHRTDVYSLGATLYELVTLEPIFHGSSRNEILQQISRQEPRLPRAVAPSLPIELETIILKAIAKLPSERYRSAKELGADLQRYLDDKPILARRPTLFDRSRKWMRRHPSVLVAGVLILLVISLGSVFSAWLIRDEQRKTQLAYEAERNRAEEAQARFLLARRSVDEMIQLAEEELINQPQMQPLRKRILEHALAYYQEFIEHRRDEPEAQAELAATRDRVQKILTDLAVLQGAAHVFLLQEPDVLDDLAVNDEQRVRIADLLKRQANQRGESFRSFHKLSPEEKRARFLEEASANEAAAASILGKKKVQRLRQIALQVQGPQAFREPEVVAALKLTLDQRERIRALEPEPFAGKPDWFSGKRPDFRGKKGRDFFREPPSSLPAVLAILTAPQRERWTALTGRPFDGRISIRIPAHFGTKPGGPPFGSGGSR